MRFRQPLLCALLVAVGALLAPLPAVALPSCAGLGPLADCTLNGVTFSDFQVTPIGIAPTFLLGPASHDHGGSAADLVFQIAHDPSPADQPADVLLTYRAQDPAARLIGVDLFNSGLNVTIQETVCRNPLVEGTCVGADNVLANYVVPGSSTGSASFDETGLLYVKKDLQFASGGFISELENSHELNPVPEPGTLLLLGTTLSGVGVAWRRRRRAAAAA